jgi:hypothetical protein
MVFKFWIMCFLSYLKTQLNCFFGDSDLILPILRKAGSAITNEFLKASNSHIYGFMKAIRVAFLQVLS